MELTYHLSSDKALRSLMAAYRYGFNGKERDDEIKGVGNHYDYGFRMYDPRLARFFSVDPLTAKYPELTPYQFASLTPIWASDLDGLEAKYETSKNADGSTQISITVNLKVLMSPDANVACSQQDRAVAIASQIEESYAGYDSGTNTHYSTKVNLTFVTEENLDRDSDYYMEFVDDVRMDFVEKNMWQGEKSGDRGWTTDPGNTNSNRFQVLNVGRAPGGYGIDTTPESQARTGAHEIGHSLGLDHKDPEVDDQNLMKGADYGTDVKSGQLKRAIETIDENKD